MSYKNNKAKKKTPMDKLLYLVIFKIAYHIGFIYYFIKRLILRR